MIRSVPQRANFTYRRRRLGEASTPGYIAQGVSTAGSVGMGIATTTGAIAAGSLAIPIIGAAIAGVTLLIGALGIGAGCGQKCVIASNEVDKIEPLMAQNAEAAAAQAAANGGCLTEAEQTQALANFDQLWSAIFNTCSNPQLGDPGKRCISERQRGGKYDYFAAHRDTISALPVCDPASSATALATAAPYSSAPISGLPPAYVYFAGAALLALILVKS